MSWSRSWTWSLPLPCRRISRSGPVLTAGTPATARRKVDYPDSDGKPMAETPFLRDNMTDSIEVLQDRYLEEANVYVSGNMMMYYVPGDKRKHVSPDVFVV